MKNLRWLYEGKIRKDDFIPTEDQFVEYEKDIIVAKKEKDGCKVEFIIKNNEVIAAVMNDETYKIENEKLSPENSQLAYNDFNSCNFSLY